MRPWQTGVAESRQKKSGSYNGAEKGLKSCQFGQMKTNRFTEEKIYAICFKCPAFLWEGRRGNMGMQNNVGQATIVGYSL
jgi:hypothetical protein